MMAALRLTLPLIVVTTSVLLLLNASTLSCTDQLVGLAQLNEEWSGLGAEVSALWQSFGTKSYTPQEILAKLESAKNILHGFVATWWKKPVQDKWNAMVDMAHTDPALCRPGYKDILPKQADYEFLESLAKYIEHHRENFIAMCTRSILEQTYKELNELDEVYKIDLNDLEELVNKKVEPAEPAKIKYWSDLLKEYVDLKKRNSSNGPVSKSDLFEKHLIGTCTKWISLSERVIKETREGEWKIHLNEEQVHTIGRVKNIGKVCTLFLRDKALMNALRKDCETDDLVIEEGDEEEEVAQEEAKLAHEEVDKDDEEMDKAVEEVKKADSEIQILSDAESQ